MKPSKRSYHQFCGLAKALDAVGERWTLLLVRDLLLGPRRYTDLLETLPGITTNLLAKRLREMEEMGLIVKTQLPPPAGSRVYRLTQEGLDLEPAILALGKWGWRNMSQPEPEDMVYFGWAMVALKRRFTASQGRWTIELRSGETFYQIRFRDQVCQMQQGKPWHADASVGAEQRVFLSLFRGNRLSGSSFEIEGDPNVWRAFKTAFGLVTSKGSAKNA